MPPDVCGFSLGGFFLYIWLLKDVNLKEELERGQSV